MQVTLVKCKKRCKQKARTRVEIRVEMEDAQEVYLSHT